MNKTICSISGIRPLASVTRAVGRRLSQPRHRKNEIAARLVCCLLAAMPANFAKAQNATTPANGAATDAHDEMQPSARTRDLTDLSIEELMSMEVQVTSASRKVESLANAPAAIFVLRAEDIRRSGFSSLPEALRMVPGLYVGKVNSHWWTISARGFNDYLNNKMLVLIDGRSVYTPHFGGVFWELQDIPLEDVDRVEVIRGPGGTLWGADAINGVINVITKTSAQTQGVSVSTSSGMDEGYSANVRYGGRAGNGLTYRVFGRASYTEPGEQPSGMNAFDFWNLSEGGMRMDWKLSKDDDLTVQSGFYEGRMQDYIPYFSNPGAPQIPLQSSFVVRGGHIQSRWHHRLPGGAGTDLLGYCDWSDRVIFVDEVRNTCRVEFQNDFNLGSRQSLIWGGNLDVTDSALYHSFTARGVPGEQRATTAGAFAQYEVHVIPDRLRLLGGAKFEHDPYTGFEIQPQIRGVWTPSEAHAVWGAVSRAVRSPTRADNSEEYKFAQLPGPVPTYLTAVGNPDLKAEVLRAYEIGYRLNPTAAFSLDAAIFYNHYDNLINLNLVNPLSAAGPPRIHLNPTFVEIALPWQNLGPGQTHGAEVYAKVRPMDRWLLAAGVTELRGNSVNLNDSLNLPVANTAQRQFNAQSRLNLTSHLEFDVSLYHYNGIPAYDFSGRSFQDVPTHNRVDVGFSFHRAGGFTFAIWGRDLGAGRHWENRPPLFTAAGSEVRGQAVVLKVMWQSNPEPAPK